MIMLQPIRNLLHLVKHGHTQFKHSRKCIILIVENYHNLFKPAHKYYVYGNHCNNGHNKLKPDHIVPVVSPAVKTAHIILMVEKNNRFNLAHIMLLMIDNDQYRLKPAHMHALLLSISAITYHPMT